MNTDIKVGLSWAGFIIATALGATFARQQGYIDGDTVTRLVVGLNGIMIAWYGNRLPKAVAPSLHAARVARITGWAQVLSGTAYAALWVFAPIPIAVAVGCAAILAGIAVSLLYCLRLRSKAKAS